MAWLNDWATGVQTVDVAPQAAETEDPSDVVKAEEASSTEQEPRTRAATPATSEEGVKPSADDDTPAVVKPDGKSERTKESTIRIEFPGSGVSWFF